MGLRRVILAVKRVDLVEFDCRGFEPVAADYRDFAALVGIQSVNAVRVVALSGDNVTVPGERVPWYEGLRPWKQSKCCLTAQAGASGCRWMK